jgi:hypothetical protein
LRHGLRRPVLADPALAREIEAAVERIAGEGASPEGRALAVAVAEAEIDLARIARVRADLIAQQAAGRDVEKQLLAIERYERRARVRREFAVEDLAAATTVGEGGVQNKAKANEAERRGASEQKEAKANEAKRWGASEQNEAKANEAKRWGASEQNKAKPNEAEGREALRVGPGHSAG